MSTLKERMAAALEHRISLAEKAGADPRDINQRQLAMFCGVSAPSVHGWFSGETKSLKGGTAIKAAKYLCVRPEWLTSGLGVMKLDAEPSQEESARWRMSLAGDPAFQPLSVRFGANNSGKSSLLGAMVEFASLAKEGVAPPQRKLLAQMVGSLFEDGPSENTAKAIDALTPQLDEPAKKAASQVPAIWRAVAMVAFDRLKDQGSLASLNGEAFAALVDQAVAAGRE